MKMKRVQRWIEEKKAKPCMDCGGRFPPECMDFDHRFGQVKLFNISKGKGVRCELLEAEMAKCDVVCSNCHRIRTRRKAGSFEHKMIVDITIERLKKGYLG